MEELPLTIYLLRHQESVKSLDGSRDYDTPLAIAGRESAYKIAKVLPHLGRIDEILSGSLQRHIETAQIFQKSIRNPILIDVPDRRLNAIPRSHFLAEDAPTAEKDYRLNEYAPGADGLYHGLDREGKEISFNPINLGIYPFDKFTCRVHLNKRLRDIIFPQDTTREMVESDILDLNRKLIKQAKRMNMPLNLLIVGSGSINALLAEYESYETIGEKIIDYHANQKSPIFTQKSDELMVLAYTQEDMNTGRNRLRLIQDNMKIRDYIKK